MNEKYRGMTVNERLFADGSLQQFIDSVNAKDTEKVVLLLKKVDLSDLSIIPILDQYGLKSK